MSERPWGTIHNAVHSIKTRH